MESFVKRRLEFAIKLASNPGLNQPDKFSESGKNTITLSDHRASVRVGMWGGYTPPSASITIWGLTQSVMNQLSTLGQQIQLMPGNVITVTAGDETGMSTVFTGNIFNAWAEYDNAPDVPFRMDCNAGALEQVIPYPASSYRGGTDVATILSKIAKDMNPPWGFENSGVNVKISNPYYEGSPLDQIRKVVQEAKINWAIIPASSIEKAQILAIWPLYGHRSAAQQGIPLIAPPPDGQMRGYPSFTNEGIQVKTIFDPRIVQGGQMKVRSSVLTPAVLQRLNNQDSVWNVMRIDLALDTLIAHGDWMMTVQGYREGAPAPLPQQSR